MHKFFFITLLLAGTVLFAQDLTILDYSWDTAPGEPLADTIDAEDGLLMELERHQVEVYLNPETNFFEEIYLQHKRILVGNSAAIDKVNKIYIPLNEVIDLLGVQARFIGKDGNTREVPEEKIRRIENLENKGSYATFAIEGVEAGGKIEYFYLLKRKLQRYRTLLAQDRIPVVRFEYIQGFPTKLDFMLKSYNRLHAPVRTELDNDQVQLRIAQENIPGISEERYAFYYPNLMRLELSLKNNYYTSSRRIASWAEYCESLYNRIYPVTKKEQKAIGKLLRAIDDPGLPMDERIRNIENRIKKSIVVSSELAGPLEIDKCLKSGMNTAYGVTRLYVGIFEQAEIPYHLVLTSDIEEKYFDPRFDGYNFIDAFVFTFPSLDKMLIPAEVSMRLGLHPFNFRSNYGLELHPVHYNEELATFGYEIVRLPGSPCEQNADSMAITLSIDIAEGEVTAEIERIFTGLLAQPLQSFWQLMDDDRKEELIGLLLDVGLQEPEILHYEVLNGRQEALGSRSMIIRAEVKSKHVLEKAGQDYILKLGETIGEQAELYHDDDRKLPVQIDVLRSYHREITLRIPAGFKVENVEDLGMNVVLENGGRESAVFKSTYELGSDELKVYHVEYYSEPFYPLDRYEGFRNVVNAAADFNKRSVLLSPAAEL